MEPLLWVGSCSEHSQPGKAGLIPISHMRNLRRGEAGDLPKVTSLVSGWAPKLTLLTFTPSGARGAQLESVSLPALWSWPVT